LGNTFENISLNIAVERKILKIEIEKVENGYILVLPNNPYDEVVIERKIVIQKKEENTFDDTNVSEFQAFHELVETLQEIFFIENSKYNKIGYITGLCSEYDRWDILQSMKESLKNPRNDTGDE